VNQPGSLISLKVYPKGPARVFLTGIHALVRLPDGQIMRPDGRPAHPRLHLRSRGSPLVGYDQQLFAARKPSRA